jgi:hypothetical protein
VRYHAFEEKTVAQTEIIFTVEESPEGGYEAGALGHAIFKQADTLEALREMVRDAVGCHVEDADGPAVIRLRRVQDKGLHA